MLVEPRQEKLFNLAFTTQPLQAAQRELDKIYRLLETKTDIDAFSIAWDAADYDVKTAVLYLCYRKHPYYFKNGSDLTPDSPAADFDVSQRNACASFLARLSDFGSITAGHMLAARELAEGYADSQCVGVA